MSPTDKFLDLQNCTIRFSTRDGEYEGVLEKVFPAAEMIFVRKVIMLPERRMGGLNFTFAELSNIRVMSRPDTPKETSDEKKDVSPVYPKTKIEKLFDFDAGSDIEDDESDDNHQGEYKMKVVPYLSKLIPKDFETIDSFNKDFSLAIKHIMRQNTIGVSLEGVNVSRSGTLTWLCISTPCCNFLFDILALGEQAFKKGLKTILEKASIQKIFHDCRLASDCLYHKYGVRLVNVFDTQVADFIAMMQMVKKEKISNRVNTLDACLNYYLEVPCDYLYGQANLDSNEDSLNFHALRPLRHEIQDVLIKNVMYLHLLKRELELALQTPLRRATDVYLNSVQKLKERELLVVEHKPDELPPDIHLEGIQIFRYREFEYFCSTVASGPPYRKVNNPIREYLNYREEYKNGQKADKQSIVNQRAIQENEVTSSKLNRKSTPVLKPVGVSSSGKSSETEQESSSDSEKIKSTKYHEAVKQKFKGKPSLRIGDGSNSFRIHKSVVESEASRPFTVKNPVVYDMSKPLSRSEKTPNGYKRATDESTPANESDSQIPAENINVDGKSVARLSSNTSEVANLKSTNNCLVSNKESEASQLPLFKRISRKELLELGLKEYFKNHPKSVSPSAEHSSSVCSTPSESMVKFSCEEGRKETNVVKSTSSNELVQTNNSLVKEKRDISDSELEEVAARVRARGAGLRNSKTRTATTAIDRPSVCDPFNRSAKFKPSSDNLEPTSENVTVYYSDVMDKPSELAVKVSRKNCRLADLYKQAGDGFLWTDKDSESVSNSSPEPVDTEQFWASIRGDLPSKPMDEKLRLRLIPAGMRGY